LILFAFINLYIRVHTYIRGLVVQGAMNIIDL